MLVTVRALVVALLILVLPESLEAELDSRKSPELETDCVALEAPAAEGDRRRSPTAWTLAKVFAVNAAFRASVARSPAGWISDETIRGSVFGYGMTHQPVRAKLKTPR